MQQVGCHTPPGSDFADLQPLKQTLAGVRLLGLGDGPAGTHEFLTARLRLLAFLVKEMGFRSLAVEQSYAAALPVDDYVQTGQGDPKALLEATRMWPLETEEMLSVVQWMRTYNETAAPEARVHYVGIAPEPGLEVYNRLFAFLGKVDPQFLEQNDKLLKQTSTYLSPLIGDTMDGRRANLAKLQALLQYVTENEAKFAALTSPAEARSAILHARSLVDIFDTYVMDTNQQVSGPKRYQHMAEMVTDLLDQAGPDAHMVLWAQNSTLNRSVGTGAALGKSLGDGYYAVELLFRDGAFRTRDRRGKEDTFTLEPESGMAEWDLNCAGLGDAFVDYRHTNRSGAIKDWLAAPRPQHAIGFTYFVDQPELFQAKVPLLNWDGLIYIRTITPSKDIP